jgi:prevent-host-death family protein
MGGRDSGVSVGVRELRQNLSVYLRRVAAGETLRVTERGRPVAVLSPLPGHGTVRDRLIAEGRLLPGNGDLLDLPSPLRLPAAMSGKMALGVEREERLP